MSSTPTELLAAALQLPVEGRAALIEGLLQSLPDEFDSVNESGFLEELDRRFVQFQENPETAVGWDELKNRLGD